MQFESEINSANQHDQSCSAGILDVDHQQTINELRSELADGKSEHAVTRAYYRQVDDAYNKEAEELAEMMEKNQEKAESKMGGKEGKARKSRSPSPGDLHVPNGPPGPPGPPDYPPDPPGQPPGFPPSWRGSTYDDNMSQSKITIAEIPKVSRTEAEKIFVGAWPKVQDVESWKSDVMKSVTLAANDGDRAAWQEWPCGRGQPRPGWH